MERGLERVALLRCEDYEPGKVYGSVKEILAFFGGMEAFVSPGQRVLLKPNMICPDGPEKLSVTHPALVEAVIRLVKEAGGAPLVGDIPCIGSAARVARASGIGEVCRRHGVEVIELSAYASESRARDPRYGRLGTARRLREADAVFNLGKVKAHDQLLLTLGVKNMFGGVGLFRRVWRHWRSAGRLHDFARMIVSTYLLEPPAFTLMDGVTAMEGRGPRGGNPNHLGLLAGGKNAVAVDRAIAEVLSLPWERLCTLTAARDLGAAGWDLSGIELCGTPLEELRVDDFDFPPPAPVEFVILRSLKILLRQLWKKSVASIGSSGPRQSYLE